LHGFQLANLWIWITVALHGVQVGACIVGINKVIVGMGYNGTT
jgi:deoxycytidylate deaminase